MELRKRRGRSWQPVLSYRPVTTLADSERSEVPSQLEDFAVIGTWGSAFLLKPRKQIPRRYTPRNDRTVGASPSDRMVSTRTSLSSSVLRPSRHPKRLPACHPERSEGCSFESLR